MDHGQLVELIESTLNSYLDEIDDLYALDTSDIAEALAARIRDTQALRMTRHTAASGS